MGSSPMSVVIQARNLGKCYQIYDQPQDRLKQSLWRGKKRFYHEFWALREVSFEVQRGEAVGIIGRNGSGKSTLLQLIAGTLTPTTGSVEVGGRVAALLELGSGFNPEFTGRENIYMNAAILGLSRAETAQRFDEIVAFADIGDFIEQPVKTYSSGMSLRLAFAVAVSVTPDVLIVDEALAVGDEVFQRKCFARIQAIQQAGAAILFVSHSAQAIVELCQGALLLDQGEQLLCGNPKSVVAQYHKLIYAAADQRAALRETIRLSGTPARADAHDTAFHADADSPIASPPVKAYFDPSLVPKSTVSYESRGALISEPRVLTPEGEAVNALINGDTYCLQYSVNFTEAASNVRFGALIKTVSGFELGGIDSAPRAAKAKSIPAGTTVVVKLMFRCLLLPGVYFVNVRCSANAGGEEQLLHRIDDSVMFRVLIRDSRIQSGIVDFEFEPAIAIGTTPTAP